MDLIQLVEVKNYMYGLFVNPEFDKNITLRKVFIDAVNCRMVASDDGTLVVFNDCDPEELDTILEQDNSVGKVPICTTSYPNISGVMLQECLDFYPFKTSELEALVLQVPPSPDEDEKRIAVTFGGIAFYPPRIVKVLHFLRFLGLEDLFIEVGPDRMQISSGRVQAVIACLGDGKNAHLELIEHYSIDDIALLGDLL